MKERTISILSALMLCQGTIRTALGWTAPARFVLGTSSTTHPFRRIAALATCHNPSIKYLSCQSGCTHSLTFTNGRYRRSHYMSSVDIDVESDTVPSSKTLESEWDVPGLKKEVSRLIQRSHKKVQQAFQRVNKAKEIVDQLVADSSASTEDLEICPDLDALTLELESVQARVRSLNTLEELLRNVANKKNMVLPTNIASLVIELGVSDAPPLRPPREKKEKGPRRDEPHRKPYRRYYSGPETSRIEIRVGKKAEDNDMLTMDPQHRDGSDWWMHASGCPGSHVVIRCGNDELPEDVIMDAAALAARQSKCTGSVIKVSLTRCRDIKKPPGAKAGLVMLTGKVRTVSVNMKDAEARLERLEKTVIVN